VTELSATLAFSAIKGNDKVGLTLFTDEIEKFVPARKRYAPRAPHHPRATLLRSIGNGTSLQKVLQHLNRTASRRTVVFLISDFQDTGYERALKIASRKHDIIPLVVGDQREFTMPNVAFSVCATPRRGRWWCSTRSAGESPGVRRVCKGVGRLSEMRSSVVATRIDSYLHRRRLRRTAPEVFHKREMHR